MKQKTFAIIPAAIIGTVCSYIGALITPIILVAVMMIIDYFTGIANAWITRTLCSRVGIVGIIKKLAMLCMIVVGGAIDFIIAKGITTAGFQIGMPFTFGLIVCVWLIINESISILENLDKIGTPVPKWLVYLIKRLKKSTESIVSSDNDDKDDK